MIHQMEMAETRKRNLGIRLLWLGVVITVFSLAARGGKPESATNATVEFDDLVIDAIQSDGLGPYGASVSGGSFAVVTVTTGKKRGISFDFSDCAIGCDGALDLSGTIRDVTLTVGSNGYALFEFTTAHGRFELTGAGTTLTGFDDDADGDIDRYVIENDGTTAAWLVKLLSRGLRGAPRQESHGSYFMPWGAEVIVK